MVTKKMENPFPLTTLLLSHPFLGARKCRGEYLLRRNLSPWIEGRLPEMTDRASVLPSKHYC